MTKRRGLRTLPGPLRKTERKAKYHHQHESADLILYSLLQTCAMLRHKCILSVLIIRKFNGGISALKRSNVCPTPLALTRNILETVIRTEANVNDCANRPTFEVRQLCCFGLNQGCAIRIGIEKNRRFRF